MSDDEYKQDSNGYGGLLDSPTFSRKSHQVPRIIKTNNTVLYPEMSKPADLHKLASANFSTESLTDPNLNLFVPLTPSPGPKYSNSPIFQPSASAHHRANSNSRARPKSAIFMMDSNYAISEDGSPIQSPINNTPRSRNSIQFGQKMSYIPADLPPTGPPSSTPSRPPSPSRSRRSTSPVRRSKSPVKYLPFNFQPQEVQNSLLQVKPAHRKGHKYKHSSVSMNLFQETPIAVTQQLSIPNLYPIPNFKESLSSISSGQKLKLSWSLFHLAMSLVIFVVGFKFKLSAMSTLAHLIFYDSLGSVVIVFVDIMSNFEVWNNSSIAYPFGLGRLEVLAGFALSSSLIMVSFDLISHFLEEFIILLVVVDTNEEHDGENHSSHHIHGEHGYHANWFVYEFTILLTILVTLISSNLILKDDKITEMISEEKALKTVPDGGILGQPRQNAAIKSPAPIEEKTATLSRFIKLWSRNPTHLLTLSYSIYLIVVPVLPTPESFVVDINEFTNLVIALLLCYIGCRLTKSLGGILLCSYPYSDYDYHVLKAVITDKILGLDFYKSTNTIEKFFITKFNYQLYVIGLKISVKGMSSDEESRLKFEINRILKREIELLDTDSKLEVTIDISRY